MADYAAIRTGLANNLKAIPDIQPSAYMLSNPTPPAAHVRTAGTRFDLTMGRGLDEITMKVQVFVPLVVDMTSQINLDKYVAGSGSLSVKQALESDRTLAGAVSDLHVSEASEPAMYRNSGGTTMIVVDFTVTILAHG